MMQRLAFLFWLLTSVSGSLGYFYWQADCQAVARTYPEFALCVYVTPEDAWVSAYEWWLL